MPDDAHAVLVFYGGIVGFIIIILCLWCFTYYCRLMSIQEVVPSLHEEEENTYTTIQHETSPLNNNI